MEEGVTPYVFFPCEEQVAVPLDANAPVLYDDSTLQTDQVAST